MNKNFADISSNNGNLNLSEYVKAEYPLIAIKLGGGHGDQWEGNPDFLAQWLEARALRGRWAYWFFKDTFSSTSGYDQAIQAMTLLEAADKPKRNDRIILDFETMMTTPAHNVDQARIFISTLQREGHTPLAYGSPGFFASFGNPNFNCDIWLADFATKMWNPGKYKIAAWQHSTVVDGKGIGSGPFGATGIGFCDMSILTSYGIRKHLR